ncbi:MAG: UDP-N-acetylmuramate dehydrogenase [Bacilli bacterium]|nr:UDP-N-acetylmuramate dehydrogenase [Bacilli bacterium]
MNSIKDITVTENVSLKKFNTYKIDSTTKYFISVKSIESLIETLKYLREHNIKYFILGGGSNVILDNYFDGAVIKLDGPSYVKFNDFEVKAGASVMLARLACETINHNLTGLEWCINIPGTLGGSIAGNAGAYNSEMFDNLISIKVLTPALEVVDMPKSAFEYSYRHTNIKAQNLIVLEGTFLLTRGNKKESQALIQDRSERRKASQPLDMPSAGSVFRNPEGDHAGRLIEAAGLKGKTIGGAMVSPKHANFIVNNGGATSNDIKNLIKLIQKEVKAKFNVDLIAEQEIIDWK